MNRTNNRHPVHPTPWDNDRTLRFPRMQFAHPHRQRQFPREAYRGGVRIKGEGEGYPAAHQSTREKSRRMRQMAKAAAKR